MKKLVLLLPLFLFTGLYIPEEFYPMLMTRSQLEASVELTHTALPLTSPGKICLYQNWIFLVEKHKGIHLIDNTNPANPVRKDFLKVPGCVDVAVRNNILYVDNAVDLVAVRLDPQNSTATVVARRNFALPEMLSPDGYLPTKYSRSMRPANTEIVGWISTFSDIK